MRPKKEEKISVRLTEEQRDKVQRIAKEKKLSESDVIRELLDKTAILSGFNIGF